MYNGLTNWGRLKADDEATNLTFVYNFCMGFFILSVEQQANYGTTF